MLICCLNTAQESILVDRKSDRCRASPLLLAGTSNSAAIAGVIWSGTTKDGRWLLFTGRGTPPACSIIWSLIPQFIFRLVHQSIDLLLLLSNVMQLTAIDQLVSTHHCFTSSIGNCPGLDANQINTSTEIQNFKFKFIDPRMFPCWVVCKRMCVN